MMMMMMMMASPGTFSQASWSIRALMVGALLVASGRSYQRASSYMIGWLEPRPTNSARIIQCIDY